MRPILFEWRGLRVSSYLVLAYLGITLGMVAQNYVAKAAGLDRARVWMATLLLLPVSFFGARLLFVVTHISVYRHKPARVWRKSEGGMAMSGGVLCMLVGSVPLLKWMGIPYWAFWDVTTFCILIGMVFMRFGCLLHGCCAGRPVYSRLAMWLPDERGDWKLRVPTQLFEIGWTVLLLAAAILAWPWRPFSGALFLCVMTGYAVGRLLFQPLRATRQRVGLIDVELAISAAVVAFSCTAWLLLRY